MADRDDKSLLERLNALKPSGVVLDTAHNALDANTTGVQPAEPLSREDALAKRLRTLRNQREHAANQQDDKTKDPPPPYSTSSATTTTTTTTTTQPPLSPPLSATKASGKHMEPPLSHLQVNEAELDEILDSLVIDDDHWSVSDEGDEADESQVQELLAKLAPHNPSGAEKLGGKNENDDDDNSEGDDVSREVDRVLAQTIDALKLDSVKEPSHQEDIASTPYPDPGISLPTVPQNADIVSSSPPGDSHDVLPDLPAIPSDSANTAETSAGLNLPTVPTALVDPAPPNTIANSFESSMANRLAALKGPGHKPLETDAFGLPSVPTSLQPVAPPLLRIKAGYTDADQKTWCVVCLEDGTVRCLDCEDGGEVYCARCWKEMHVGPAAGYDERGHQWVKFDPRRR